MLKNTRFHGVASRRGSDQAFFVLAFLIGVLGILVAKYHEVSIFVVALIPISVLILYAFISWNFHRVHLEPDLIGDNCYYLGFIFTLVSLAWTLYAVSTAEDQQNNAVVLQVISGFGVALASTIFGIFLRAFFLQLRPDPVSSERKARKDILDAARDLRTELSQSVKEFKSFMIEAQQNTDEHRAKLDEATKQALEAHQSWMERYARDTAQIIADIHTESIEKVIGTMDESGKVAIKIIEDNLNNSGQMLQNKINELANVFDNSSQKIDAKTQEVSISINTLGDRVAIAANALQVAAAGAADRVRSSGNFISESAQGFGEQFAAASNEFQISSASITEKINISGNSILESVQGFDEEVKAYITAMQQRRIGLQSALDGIGRTLESRLNKAAEQTEQFGFLIDNRFTELESRFFKASESTKAASDEMSKAAKIVSDISSFLEEAYYKMSAFEQLPSAEESKIIASELKNAVLSVQNLAREIECIPNIIQDLLLKKDFSSAEFSSGSLRSKPISLSKTTDQP